MAEQGDAGCSDWLIDAQHVKKKYCRDLRRSLWYGISDVMGAFSLHEPGGHRLREHEFWAVDDVSFQLRRGESLAVLGRNGAGKSTLLKLMTGQRAVTAGMIRTRGRMVGLTELGLGFDPVLTGRENAYINAAVHGISRREFDQVIEDVIEFSGIREFIDSAVQTYSSGMKARLGFSVATHLNPDIFIIDEVLSVGDLEFKRRCIQRMLRYVKDGGSILLVSHEPYLVQSICDRCVVLERGKLVFEGTAVEGVDFHFKRARGMTEGSSEMEDEAQGGLAEDAASAGQGNVDLDDPAWLEGLSAENPVALERLEVLGGRGTVPRTGGASTVRLTYRSLQSMEVLWGFEFLTADLQTSIASFSRGLDGSTSRLERGRHALICRIPDFPLQPGNYAARGAIGDVMTKAAWALIGYRDQPQYFSVVGPEVSLENNIIMGRNSLVSVTAEWVS